MRDTRSSRDPCWTSWHEMRTRRSPRRNARLVASRRSTGSSAANGAGSGAGGGSPAGATAAAISQQQRLEVLRVADEVARAEVDPVAAELGEVERAGVGRPRARRADPVLRRDRAGALPVVAGQRDARRTGVARHGRRAVDPRGRDRRCLVDLHRDRSGLGDVPGDVAGAELHEVRAGLLDDDRRRGRPSRRRRRRGTPCRSRPSPGRRSPRRRTVTAPSCQPSVPKGSTGYTAAVVSGAVGSTLSGTEWKPSALPAPSIARYSKSYSPAVVSRNGAEVGRCWPPLSRHSVCSTPAPPSSSCASIVTRTGLLYQPSLPSGAAGSNADLGHGRGLVVREVQRAGEVGHVERAVRRLERERHEVGARVALVAVRVGRQRHRDELLRPGGDVGGAVEDAAGRAVLAGGGPAAAARADGDVRLRVPGLAPVGPVDVGHGLRRAVVEAQRERAAARAVGRRAEEVDARVRLLLLLAEVERLPAGTAARLATLPVVSGIRTGTSSTSSSGAGPTVRDGGMSSPLNAYGPRICALARVSSRVMPIVVKMFVAASADAAPASAHTSASSTTVPRTATDQHVRTGRIRVLLPRLSPCTSMRRPVCPGPLPPDGRGRRRPTFGAARKVLPSTRGCQWLSSDRLQKSAGGIDKVHHLIRLSDRSCVRPSRRPGARQGEQREWERDEPSIEGGVAAPWRASGDRVARRHGHARRRRRREQRAGRHDQRVRAARGSPPTSRSRRATR